MFGKLEQPKLSKPILKKVMHVSSASFLIVYIGQMEYPTNLLSVIQFSQLDNS